MSETSITTYYSSRTEDLVECLFYQLENDASSPINTPFGQSHIIVPNSGMQRYLELSIAKRFGICSHITLGYAGQLITNVYQAVLNTHSSHHNNERLLTFTLLQLWSNGIVPQSPYFDALYQQHQQPRQRYLLAQKIAGLLRNYFNDRPEMINTWQHNGLTTQNPHEIWQREILHQLLDALPSIETNKTPLIQQLSHDLSNEGAQKKAQAVVPPLIHIFGFHALPPSQLQELTAISQATKIQCYTFNPCLAYWQDIVPERVKERRAITKADQAELLTVGHPLLASWGQAGKHYIEQLNEHTTHHVDALLKEQSPHENPKSVLTWLQEDIRELGDPVINALDAFQQEQEQQTNPSISLHACSTPRREVEVLYDNLCKQFKNETLNPADILVIVPSLKDYAPHIQAIFARTQGQSIPYSLANQTSSETEPDVQAFLSLLSVIESDFQAQRLFECLCEEYIQRALGLEQKHLNTLRYWFFESHYSLHFNDKSNGDSSSLEKLLDSLLLASVGGDDCQLGNRTANNHFHQGQLDTLSHLCDIWQRFYPLANLKTKKLTLSQWRDKLKMLAERFLSTEHHIDEYINEWFDSIDEIDDSTRYDFSTISTDITSLLRNNTLHGPFLSGGVSFCAVVPMRSIPAKLIAVLGLNNNFPTISTKDPLDLRLETPLWSDKNLHKEQCYFFLETLMATREQLYLSYLGLDEKTKETIPPSALIRELLNYLERKIPSFGAYATTIYPLQGFMSASSFQTLYNSPDIQDHTVFESNDCVELPDSLTVSAMADIILEPLMGFWRYHLGAEPLNKTNEPLAEHEFIATESGLDTWKYRTTALDLVRNSDSLAIAALKKQNCYAPTTISNALLDKATQFVTPLSEHLQNYDLSDIEHIKSQCKRIIHDRPLYVSIDCMRYPHVGLVTEHLSALTAKKYLRAWLQHILYHCFAEHTPCTSVLLTMSKNIVKKITFAPITNHTSAQQTLDQVLQLCHSAIQQPYPLELTISPVKAETTLHYNPKEYSLYPEIANLDNDHELFLAQWELLDQMIGE